MQSAKQWPAFKVPVGLILVLGLYSGAVAAYVWATWYRAPEYQAALSWREALTLLGDDDGRSCSEQELTRAFELLLTTARLLPADRRPVQHLEALRSRFDERKFKLRPELVQRAEMMAANTRRLEKQKEGWLVVSAHDKGWTPAQVLGGPRRAVLWSIPGAVFIIAFWAYTQLSRRARLADDHEAQLQAQEQDVAALGDFRRRLPGPPKPVGQTGVRTTGKVVTGSVKALKREK